MSNINFADYFKSGHKKTPMLATGPSIVKINVQVKLHSKKESIELLEDGTYLIRFNTPPIEGKANEKIIELLSQYLKAPKSKFKIISGFKSKSKIIEWI